MPRRTKEAPHTPQEARFLEAIERILNERPSEKSLKARIATGKKVALTMTNVALEAGFARTYLYKNREAMARVWARIEAIEPSGNSNPGFGDINRMLREHNARLRAERDLAIDAARRCMQETIRLREDSSDTKARMRLERELKALRSRLSHLEAENEYLRSNSAGNVVPFGS